MSYNLNGAAFGGNITLSKAGLAAGTTNTYTIANAVTFAVRGRLYNLAAAANAATPVVDLNTGLAFKPLAANQACLFAFLANEAGGVSVVQGPIASNLDLINQVGAAQFPGLPDTSAPFGYVLVQAGATLASPWTFGLGNLSGVTGLTLTFRDLMDIPAQPIYA